jgi:alanyl-tRNA synthetase
MAGNFSFGDYFKEGAIPFAWELLTRPQSDGGYGFPESKLWATVYDSDDEALEIWHKVVGLPLERIQRRDAKDNYWSMGVPGPGGPCSEIYYDRGPEHGIEGGPVADEDRYLEVWNLVFMQHELSAVRSKMDFDIKGDLPAKNIDTGMGLERMAALLQGVENIYEIDTTRHILDRAAALSGATYGADHENDVRLRVVADHARTVAFLIQDGVLPGNEGRGYVLRRILRRVVRNMRLLGAGDPVMGELIDASVQAMGPQYPELLDDAGRLASIATTEESLFAQTLRTGTTIFDTAVADLQKAGGTTLGGEQAFALHDTFGFPIDLTLEMASEKGIEVDQDGFRRLMAEQRDRAKADARQRKTGLTNTTVYRSIMDASGVTSFTGYDEVVSEATLRGLLVDGVDVQSAREGDAVEVVLDRTPFYAEGGGQLADAGVITLADGAVLEVDDVQQPVPGLYVHRGRVLTGEAVVGQPVVGAVDLERRRAISRAHTATHLVHKAFREALGETATQMGSENSPGRFRFDFPLSSAVPPSVMADVEARVNDVLAEDLVVHAEYMSQEAARAIGAMALFGEKYGDSVRVVSVGDWTRELCGGTHAQRSGQVGIVKFLSEGSIGAGVRRVEAIVGVDAYRFLAREHLLVSQLSDIVKARPEELPERIDAMLVRLKDAERDIGRMRSAALVANIDGLIGEAQDYGDVRMWTFVAPEGTDAGGLRELVTKGRDKARREIPSVLIGAAVSDGKVSLVAATNEAGRSAGQSANRVLQAALGVVGGRGGGKDDLAQGGGTDVSAVDAALEAARAAVRGGV